MFVSAGVCLCPSQGTRSSVSSGITIALYPQYLPGAIASRKKCVGNNCQVKGKLGFEPSGCFCLYVLLRYRRTRPYFQCFYENSQCCQCFVSYFVYFVLMPTAIHFLNSFNIFCNKHWVLVPWWFCLNWLNVSITGAVAAAFRGVYSRAGWPHAGGPRPAALVSRGPPGLELSHSPCFFTTLCLDLAGHSLRQWVCSRNADPAPLKACCSLWPTFLLWICSWRRLSSPTCKLIWS